MFPFKKTLTTKNITKGTNTKEFIIVHHTGTQEWTLNGVLNQLTNNLSCHFVIDTNGDAYKIWSPDDILWHAGESSWQGRTDMNRYSLGIEVIGPLSNGGFTDAQRVTVRKLIQHLMATFKIPNKNVLRHRDIAPKRKTDIADTFWKINRTTWKEYQDSLIPKSI